MEQLVTNKQNIKISKFLSLILRHKPETIDIELDVNGWVDVKELIFKMKPKIEINFKILEYVVETNTKKRFTFNEDRSKIRASQGHSIKVDLNYKRKTPPETLYHGTSNKFVDSILKDGINKMKRQHVHLSLDKETALKVGQRHGKPVILEVLAEKMSNDGYIFFLSKNGVWLTEYVPTKYIKS